MNFFYSFGFYILFFTIFLILALCFFIPIFLNYGMLISYIPNFDLKYYNIENSQILWPTPGYTTITSGFGYRNSPTSGARNISWWNRYWSTWTEQILYHLAIGCVTFIGFKGANGYTITIQNNDLTFSYSHVSPNFLVYVGEFIYRGQIIGNVGPKNVYDVLNNPYKDFNGYPTNRCYYRSASSFFNKKRRPSRQSFKLFLNFTYHLPHHEVYIHHNFQCILVAHYHFPSLVLLYYYILDILFLL